MPRWQGIEMLLNLVVALRDLALAEV